MINKNNELPSFVNETNLPKIVDKLTDASNIKIASNKYGNRVQTVIDKIVEKADDITKAINQEVINNSYSFKVGTGDVNVSADVQDGFGEIGVKGVTYQNLLGILVSVGREWVESDNKYTLNLPSGNGQPQIRYDLVYPLKPNAKYTLICEIKEYTTGYPHFCFMTKDNTTLASTTEFVPNSVGIKTAILTTKSDVKAELFRILPRANTDNIYSIGKNIILLEGDHTNNPNLPLYFEGIVGVGDKSKNLLNPNSFKSSTGISMIENQVINIDVPTDGGQRTIFEGLNLPAGTYRVTTKVLEGEYTGGNLLFYDSNGNKFTEDRLIGSRIINATNNNINKLSIWAVKGICKIRIQLEKGSNETPYEPYHDGHKIEILSCGKNLYKPNLQIKSANGLTFSLHGNTLIVNGTCTKIVDFRPINGTESITLELYNYVSKLPVGTTLKLSNNLGLKNFFSLKRNGVQTYPSNTLIVQEGDYGISCFVRFEEGQSYNNAELKIQLEINNVATEFEPYKEDKTQIFLDEPLMRLPNGVCDEITRDGKLIRRVGKYIFNGDEGFSLANTDVDSADGFTTVFAYKLNSNIQVNGGFVCDKFKYYKYDADFRTYKNEESCSDGGGYKRQYFRISNSKLSTADVEGFKQWLSQNPTTVYYELAEPIVTELPASYLRIFKDGHLTFNTLVTPESNHVVQLNKSAQIQNAIKESQSLDNRIDVLENNYDNLMLSTISRLNDLELNYTLK